jgi:NADPH:quinone reductase-like Zn-dependent oxidoreductase
MKAVVYRRYGGPEVLEYTDILGPGERGPGEALVDIAVAMACVQMLRCLPAAAGADFS